jgi:N-acetyl-gamma-glutamyl-phosphate reductase
MASARVPVAVLGASGYTGGELVRLLLEHPTADIVYLGVRDAANRTLAEEHPFLAGRTDLVLRDLDAAAAASVADFVFLAMPHGLSAEQAPAALSAGARVIDLGGDFRLPADAYPEWYGFEHPSQDWLAKAVYGLPELFADQIRDAQLVANPGCYPTPAILGLAPLLRAGLVENGPVLVDGKSGLSGAGKALTDAMMFATSHESVRPYKVPRHQHTPEIEHILGLATAGPPPRAVFVPHLVPQVRGVLCTSYVRLASDATTTEELTRCLAAAYAERPFVQVLPPGGMVDTKRVRGSNTIELQAVADGRTGQAIVIGAIDNLVKGAAGQAIQNFNIMNGFGEAEGLSTVGMYP